MSIILPCNNLLLLLLQPRLFCGRLRLLSFSLSFSLLFLFPVTSACNTRSIYRRYCRRRCCCYHPTTARPCFCVVVLLCCVTRTYSYCYRCVVVVMFCTISSMVSENTDDDRRTYVRMDRQTQRSFPFETTRTRGIGNESIIPVRILHDMT